MANVKLTPEVTAILERATFTTNSVKLPPGQLDRPLYEAVNKVLVNAGGKWNRSAQAHIFTGDPRPKLGLALETGVSVDEQKKFQAFYTPPELAAQVVELAMVKGKRVLEPSAGRGALVKECLALGATEVDCIELNPENLNHLSAFHSDEKPVSVHIGDFLEYDGGIEADDGEDKFDRIVMNPPFTRDQDILHVEHALKWLAPGGILVAIMLDNVGRAKFQALTGKFDEQEIAYSFIKVPEKTFKDTPVRTIILKVKLPAPIVHCAKCKATFSWKSKCPSCGHPQVIEMPAPSEPKPKPVAAAPPQNDKSNMKLTITRSDLLRALADIKAAASPTATPPVLANVLLVATNGSLTFTSSDLEINLRRHAKATVTEPGKTTVRAGLLYDIARSATQPTVSLNLVRKALHVECGTVKFKLATIDAEEFPPFPRVKDAVEFSLTEAQLHSMLSRTAFATSDDAERLILNGSLLQLNGSLNVVACDGRRIGLINDDSPQTKDNSKIDLIIPANAVGHLLRLLETKVVAATPPSPLPRVAATPPSPESGSDASSPAAPICEVAVGTNSASFTFGETILVTKLIEGKYPDYRKIIPKGDVPVASVQRADLLAAVSRISLVAKAVELTFHKQSLVITSSRLAAGENDDLFGEASDSLLCASARDVTIILGAAYLRDALSATSVEEIEFYEDNNIAMFKSPQEKWLAVIAGMSEKAATTKPEPTKK